MKKIIITLSLLLFCSFAAHSQTLADAKKQYLAGEYAKALPVFETEYNLKPSDASLNHWYGVCLVETGGDVVIAEKCLLVASKKKIRDSFLYLGQIFTYQYRFEEAEAAFDSFEGMLKKKGDDAPRDLLESKKKEWSRLHRMATSTEDIQFIDSLVVRKSDFLSAYKLSSSSGRVDYFNKVFSANKSIESVVYFNEKETKIYFAQPDTSSSYSLYSMEKLLEEYGNEKKLSANNFGLIGNVNYPFIMPDGVTIYFAAEDKETIGGYDLFVSRYNMNNDTYLVPERMNMPFNSIYNDYMFAIDEEKEIGWFVSDRFQPEGMVCVYTFIPNSTTKRVEGDEDSYKAKRALISSIKDSWVGGKDYSNLITLAQKEVEVKVKVVRDFEFVVNDKHTYFTLADFTSKVARDTYYKLIQSKSELNTLEADLEKQRSNYRKLSPEDQRRGVSAILAMEKKQEQLQREIDQLELLARNQEVKDLREAQY